MLKVNDNKKDPNENVNQPRYITITLSLFNNYSKSARWISNGNRTEWSPIRSVIIRVITKSDDRAAGVRFVYHE